MPCLDADQKLNLKKHFIAPETLHIKPWYVSDPIPSSESERMEILSLAIHSHYIHEKNAPAKVTRIINGSRDGYCRFTGGGDIHIEKHEMSLVITNAQEEDDPSLSPREDGQVVRLRVKRQIVRAAKVYCTSYLRI